MQLHDNLVLISGKSATGKSASLMNIVSPEGVIYLNCENNKKLPFRSKFKEFGITDPLQVYEAFTEAESMDDVHTIIIDSLTYMMDMYETYYVINSSNTMKAWGDYAQFFKKLMSKYVAESTKNVIFIAHTSDVMNDSEMAMETIVKVKGSLMNQGIESYFSTIVSTKKVQLKQLKNYESSLLDISPDEEALGFKYVYQTRITKDTVNERMRAPLSMWSTKETYIDNNIEAVIDRLHEYYV
jgi:hypothetical protein